MFRGGKVELDLPLSPGWKIRSKDIEIYPENVYGTYPTYFCIKVFHGGVFKGFPGRVYKGGIVNHVDLLDSDNFNVHELDKIAKKLGYSAPLFYHFKIPGGDLDTGLLALGGDEDVHNLTNYVSQHKEFEVYIEHGETTLDSYYRSPNKQIIVIEELPCDVLMLSPQHNRRRKQPCRRLQLEYGEGRSTQEPSQAGDDKLDGQLNEENDYLVGDEQRDLVVELMEDDLENEVVNDVNHEAENQKAAASFERTKEGYVGDADDDSDDSDYEPPYYEAEHEINEVEVDMREFRCNIDPDVEWCGLSDKEAGQTSQVHEGHVNILEFDEIERLSSSASEDVDDQSRRYKKKKKVKYPQFNSDKDLENPNFFLGQQFGSKKDVKAAVEVHSIRTRRQLKVIKNDKTRVRARCLGTYPKPLDDDETNDGLNKCKQEVEQEVETEQCPWVLYVAKDPDCATWSVKTYDNEHKCLQSRNIKACTAKYLATQIEDEVKTNPLVPVSSIQNLCQKKLEINISSFKAFRAKAKAHTNLIGDYAQQYALLRDYALELQRSNPGTTVRIECQPCPNPTETTRIFKRMYVCLGPLKEGYKASGRELLGLDGAFMKGPYPGQLFSAVAVDSNNGIYPVAYALVETENMSAWAWFLECLADDLNLGRNSNYTFISDRQKGLIPALAKVLPCAEHRFCLQHIYQNMKREGYKGKAFKDLLWKAACATTVQDYAVVMEEFKVLDAKAYDWICKIKPEHWSRSHFSGRAKCDVLYNNMCESFNKELVPGRDKPVLTCFEFIREYLMKHIVVVQKEISKSHGILCPSIARIFRNIIGEAARYTAIWNGGDKYQVSGPQFDEGVVDLVAKSCTCRKWELTSMPCKHAVAAIWVHGENGGQGIPEMWVDPVYRLDTWKKIYSFKLNPINGRKMWPRSNCPTLLKPPIHHPQSGRPRKCRKKDSVEIESEKEKAKEKAAATSQQTGSQTKMPRSIVTLKCSKCGNPGHNNRTCRGQGGAQSSAQNKLPTKRKATDSGVATSQGGSQSKGSQGRSFKGKAVQDKGSMGKEAQSRGNKGKPSVTGSQGGHLNNIGTQGSSAGDAGAYTRSQPRASQDSGPSVAWMKGLLFATKPRK